MRLSFSAEELMQAQQDRNAPDVQQLPERPAQEPALFDAYGTHQSIRNP